jgi:uncharacterized membrane protein YdfJ with MMPL/SSD domain
LTPVLYRLGHFCARHPVRVLAVWLVVALAIVGVARSVGQETNDDLSLPGTDSQAASNLLSDKFPDQANGSVPIAFRAPAGDRLSDAKYNKPIERVTRVYSKDPAVTKAIGPFSEQWKETNDPHEAVVHGLASTARVITSAAMIMVSVFLAFVINGDPTVKQFGLGMAVAVDTTVVRCVLVPAIMSLLGSSGWWLPKWMERATPKYSIESNEWFAAHETPAEHANALPQKPEEHQEPDRAK